MMPRPLALVAVASLLVASACRNDPPRPRPRPTPPPVAQPGNTPPEDAPPPRPPVEVSPGVGIGPINIQMPRTAVEALGLTARPVGDTGAIAYGPYTVRYSESDTVSEVEVAVSSQDFPQGLRSYGRVLPSDANFQQMTDALTDCTPPEVLEGGNVAHCGQGKLLVLQGSGGGPVRVRTTHPGAAGRRSALL